MMVVSSLKKKTFFISLVIILMPITFLFIVINQNRFEAQCDATFEYRNSSGNLVLPLTATLILRRNATGVIQMSGVFYSNDSNFRVLRNISFDYSKENSGLYNISNIRLSKSNYDNVDDDFMANNFFSAGTGKERFMSVLKVKNTLIVGNVHSPVFICVLK